ncbi:MAG: hypothetical protein KAI47_17620, partial [Deltaproteobacteria bacterium]|nr:hypothetical protein [Deltaproteobacteria bacterium]
GGGAREAGVPDGSRDGGPVPPGTSHPPYVKTSEGFALRAPLFTTENLMGIDAIGAADVWVVGDHGLVIHYDGHAMRRVKTDVTTDFRGVWCHGHDDVWIVGAGGTILHVTKDLVSSAGPGSVKTTLNAIDGLADGQLWVVGDGGMILHRNVSGKWGTNTSGVFHPLRGVHAVSASLVWAAGDGVDALRFDGTKWEHLAAGTSLAKGAVFARAKDDAWIADTGGILQYDGTKWTTDSTAVMPLRVRGVHGDSEGLWAAGGSKVLARASGSGSWSVSHDFGAGTSFNAVHRASGVTYACGDTGLLAWGRGASWRRIWATTNHLWALAGAGGRVWVGGDSGTVAYDDGKGWRQVAWVNPPNASVMGLWSAGPASTWVVTNKGRIAAYDSKDGTLVEEHDGTVPLWAIWGASVTALWAVGDNGTVLSSKGDGTWTSVTIPGGEGIPWADVWGSSASDVYVVGVKGRIAHFDGKDWAMLNVTGQAPFDLHAVHGLSLDNVWMVGDSGVVWHYDGASFRNLGGTGTLVGKAFRGVYVAPSGRVWMVAHGDSAVFSYDPKGTAGKQWQSYAIPDKVPMSAIWGAGEEDIWIAGAKGRVYHYKE